MASRPESSDREVEENNLMALCVIIQSLVWFGSCFSQAFLSGFVVKKWREPAIPAILLFFHWNSYSLLKKYIPNSPSQSLQGIKVKISTVSDLHDNTDNALNF